MEKEKCDLPNGICQLLKFEGFFQSTSEALLFSVVLTRIASFIIQDCAVDCCHFFSASLSLVRGERPRKFEKANFVMAYF